MLARKALLALTLLIASCGPPMTIAPPADLTNPPSNAITTKTGLVYAVLKQGGGASPRVTDKVTVHYTGWTMDGKMFDSSVAKGVPANFAVNEVIPGWTEALLLMKAGTKLRVWIPEDLAYRGQPGFPAGTLVFDMTLISVD
jgi:peptidylprolyl isomerase